MPRTRKSPPGELVVARTAKRVPFAVVLDELADRAPWTRPMFGCTAVYIEEKIVLVLRDGKDDADNGVWLATSKEHHASLRRDFPEMRSITVFGSGDSSWQVLPESVAGFEACTPAR
jgi:hypothetical protein